jgi:hypothetical protein
MNKWTERWWIDFLCSFPRPLSRPFLRTAEHPLRTWSKVIPFPQTDKTEEKIEALFFCRPLHLEFPLLLLLLLLLHHWRLLVPQEQKHRGIEHLTLVSEGKIISWQPKCLFTTLGCSCVWLIQSSSLDVWMERYLKLLQLGTSFLLSRETVCLHLPDNVDASVYVKVLD